MSIVLIVLFGLAGLVLAPVIVLQWRQADTWNEGRPLHLVLWGMALTSCALSVLKSVGEASLATSVAAFAGVIFPSILLAGSIGSCWIKGRSTQPLVPVVLLLLSVVLYISALLNGQIGVVPWLIAIGLLYMPGLTVVIWKTSAPVESIRGTIRQISVFIVWASLAFAVVDLPRAMGDLPRRFQIGPFESRLSGVTPHPNLLAFTAAIALFLLLATRARFRLVHVSACLIILVLAEARTLTVGLVVGLLAYIIVTARGSRLIRMAWAVTISSFLLVALKPLISSAFDNSSLGDDVTTFNSRTQAWGLVEEYWVERPLFGWGPFVFDDHTASPVSVLFFNHAHNQFLEALIESGLLGLICMLAVVAAITWSLLVSRDGPYAATAAMTLIFMLTEVPFTLHNYGFSFAVVIGALLLAILVPGPAPASGSTPPELCRSGSGRGRAASTTISTSLEGVAYLPAVSHGTRGAESGRRLRRHSWDSLGGLHRADD